MMFKEALSDAENTIYQVICDGQPHLRKEMLEALKKTLKDTQLTFDNMNMHISLLRAKLPAGYLILCVLINGRQIGYRMARKIPDPSYE